MLQNIWDKYQAHDVQVVAVHAWATQAEMQTWLATLTDPVTFPMIQDDTNAITSAYGITYVPRTFIIDRSDVIQKDQTGSEPQSTTEGKIMDVAYMRDPIDVEMVMDVSDSMNSPSTGDSKLTMLKQSMSIITDFFHDHGQGTDRMGLIWFTDDVSQYDDSSGDHLLPVASNWSILKNQINAHGTGICTAMGAGLQTAFDNLASSTQKKFVILCTDGMQNIEPKVTKVGTHYEIINDPGSYSCGGPSSIAPKPGVNITSYNTRVHTIGVGITASYASLLQDIANETGGFYKGTNDPATDLDLLYILDLCNCMAGASPAVVLHRAGTLYDKECYAVETFCINKSVRKITVALSWSDAQGSDLTFWLYGPDGTLLDLHHEMKLFDDYCLATVYLPKLQDEEELPYVGHWKMLIRGETNGASADYHAIVIAEDKDVKFHLEYPKKTFEVGELLPLKVNLTELKEPVLKIRDIKIETSYLRVPLEELLAQYRVSHYELYGCAGKKAGLTGKKAVLEKLELMLEDPVFQARLKPVRELLSVAAGNLNYEIRENEVVIPAELRKPGLHSFKVEVNAETANGPICRTDLVTVIVEPGKPDIKLTNVVAARISAKARTGTILTMTPKNEFGQLLGPGLTSEIEVTVAGKPLEVETTDSLDGTYRIEVIKPPRKKVEGPVNVTIKGQSIWEGKL